MSTVSKEENHAVRTPADYLAEIAGIGRDNIRGGYSRPVFSEPERTLLAWFTDRARELDLDVEVDANGITWAWWDAADGNREQAIGSGSHLDSVPGGGNFDGPLGVVSALSAVASLKAQGFRPSRPIAVLVFPEEEGSQFGIACLGSLLATGKVDPERVRGLESQEGVSYLHLAKEAGMNPYAIGADPEGLGRLSAFVELHIEQGIGLINLGQPVAIAGSILGHGRWKVRITGHGDHAGTTPMEGRRDPMQVAAETITAIRQEALRVPGARGTTGKIEALPGGTNVIPSQVTVWLDVRAASDEEAHVIVAKVSGRVRAAAETEGCEVEITEESYSPTVHFDSGVSAKIKEAIPDAPILDTGAGHDSGVLSTELPTAMLFVRNPTGISHSPLEHASDEDTAAGAEALMRALRALSA